MILKHLICYLLISLLIVPTGWASQQRAIRPVSLKMPDGNQVKLYQGSYALVIGASNYQDNAWGDLSSVGEDVSAVRQALEGQGVQVHRIDHTASISAAERPSQRPRATVPTQPAEQARVERRGQVCCTFEGFDARRCLRRRRG